MATLEEVGLKVVARFFLALFLAAVAVSALYLWPIALFAPIGDNAFVMVRPDQRSCLTVNWTTKEILMSSCESQPDVWRFVDGTLRNLAYPDMCVTSQINQSSSDEQEKRLVYDIRNDSISELDREKPFIHGVDLMKPLVLELCSNTKAMRNTSYLSNSTADVVTKTHLFDQQQWKNDGHNILQSAWYFARVKQTSAWDLSYSGWQINQSLKLWAFGSDEPVISKLKGRDARPLSLSMELRQCGSSKLCQGRGTPNEHSCACDCRAPWAGPLCLDVDEQYIGNLTCLQKQEVGPAWQFSERHIWLMLRSHVAPVYASMLSAFVQFVLGLLLVCVIGCLGNCTPKLSPGDVDDKTKECLLKFACLVCIVVYGLLFSQALFFWVSRLFWPALQIVVPLPYYANYNRGKWPHADRSILFCIEEVGFSTYVLIPNAISLAKSIPGLFARTAKDYNDHDEVLGISCPWLMSTTFIFSEITNLWTFTGTTFLVLSSGSLYLKVVVLYLAIAQAIEIAVLVALQLNKPDSARWHTCETAFLCAQDLPQLCFLVYCVVVGFPGQVTQYQLYSILSSASFVMTQVARVAWQRPAQHSGGEANYQPVAP